MPESKEHGDIPVEQRGDHLRNAQEAVDRFAAVRSRPDRRPGMVGARAVAKCRRAGAVRSSGSAGRQDRWPGAQYGRSTRRRLEISGSRSSDLDAQWAAAVLGTSAAMPKFDDPIMAALARAHAGLRPWSAGSLFEGVVSSIVGQSISVAAAATTERRLCERFNDGLHLDGRQFWPPPLPEQLASSSAGVCPRIGGDDETSRGSRRGRNAIRVRAEVRQRSMPIQSRPWNAGVHFRDWAMDHPIGTLVGHRGP